jgi:hypothetical protein
MAGNVALRHGLFVCLCALGRFAFLCSVRANCLFVWAGALLRSARTESGYLLRVLRVLRVPAATARLVGLCMSFVRSFVRSLMCFEVVRVCAMQCRAKSLYRWTTRAVVCRPPSRPPPRSSSSRCTRTHTHARTHAHAHTHIHTHTHAHTHTHSHTHAHTHTHTHPSKGTQAILRRSTAPARPSGPPGRCWFACAFVCLFVGVCLFVALPVGLCVCLRVCCFVGLLVCVSVRLRLRGFL